MTRRERRERRVKTQPVKKPEVITPVEVESGFKRRMKKIQQNVFLLVLSIVVTAIIAGFAIRLLVTWLSGFFM